MSDSIDIRCPKCSSLMRLMRPRVTSQVECPKCARPIIIRPNGTVSTAIPKASFKRLPAKLVVRVAAPQRPPQVPPPEAYEEHDEEALRLEQERLERRHQARRKEAKRRARTLRMTLFATMLVTVGGLVLFVYREDLFGAGRTLLTGEDDHRRVIADASTTISRLSKLLNSVEGARSRESIASTVEDSLLQMDRLTGRAAALPSIATDQYEIEREALCRILTAPQYNSLQRGTIIAASQKLYANDRLGVQLNDVQEKVERFIEVCNASWLAIPEPQSPLERREHKLVGSLQKVWGALMNARSRRAFASCGTMVDKADASIHDVLTNNDNGPMFLRDSRYHEAVAFFSSRIESRLRRLTVDFGTPRNIAVFDQFTMTLRATVPVSSAEAERTGTRYAARTPAAVFGVAYIPLRDAGANAAIDRVASSTRSPTIETGLVDRPSSVSKSDDAGGQPSVVWKSMLRSFRERWENEKTAVIWIRNAPDGGGFANLVSKLRGEVRPKGIRSMIVGDRALVAITYPGTMRSLAEDLEWAIDIEINEQDRSMVVTYRAFY